MIPATAMASGAPGLLALRYHAIDNPWKKAALHVDTVSKMYVADLGYHRCIKLAVSAQVGREIVRSNERKTRIGTLAISPFWRYRPSDPS
jgi:hypothetical protein